MGIRCDAGEKSHHSTNQYGHNFWYMYYTHAHTHTHTNTQSNTQKRLVSNNEAQCTPQKRTWSNHLSNPSKLNGYILEQLRHSK